MRKKSIWIDQYNNKQFPKLNENKKVDVLIIGGGISGLLCAYELKKRGVNYLIVEKDKIGRGITKNTTAFLSIHHDILYQDLIKYQGVNKAKQYLNLNLKALQKYKELNDDLDIGLEDCASIMYTSLNNQTIENEKEALEKLNYYSEIIEDFPDEVVSLGQEIKKGIKCYNQGKLNPAKLINKISSCLNIYEYTKVEKILGNTAYLDNDIKINFKNVVICTHFPFINTFGLYFSKMHQRLSYVLGFKYPKIKDTYCSIDTDGMYFRSHDDYLIIGGNDRDHSNYKDISFFKDRVLKTLKEEVNIEYEWINQDCISLDNIPYIGKYDTFHNNRFVITGFNMWGFSWAMASSFIIADLLEGKNHYELVNPFRSMINKQLFINLGNTIKNLAVLKKPRCTHLGGALNFNSKDKTWECPIHGSRFTEEGNIINGPAKRRIKINKGFTLNMKESVNKR